MNCAALQNTLVWLASDVVLVACTRFRRHLISCLHEALEFDGTQLKQLRRNSTLTLLVAVAKVSRCRRYKNPSGQVNWWDQYNLGRMGVYTGSVASELGTQHRRVPTWVPAAPVAAPSKSFVAPTPVASVASTQAVNPFRLVGKTLFYFFGAVAAFRMPGIVAANPECLVSFAVVGTACALYRRYRARSKGLRAL